MTSSFPFASYKVFIEPSIGFTGNVATVVELPAVLDKKKMQEMAADFNQPATTFIWPGNTRSDWNTLWFAPDSEIGLCGHGSMAAIAYLSDTYQLKNTVLHYTGGIIIGATTANTLGSLTLKAINDARECTPEKALEDGLGAEINEYYTTSNKSIVVVNNELTVLNLEPDFDRLKDCEEFGFIVTAKGNDIDFVSRTLVPHVELLEDPATGSSHAILSPFWGKRLGKNQMTAHQLSQRGGKFVCSIEGDMVTLTGNFGLLARGQVNIKIE